MFSPKITESSVSVTLSKNSFDKDSYIVRVPRKTLDLANIVSDIRAGYPSLDPYVINHAAELIKEQILKYLKAGKAVNILELGTKYKIEDVNRAIEEAKEGVNVKTMLVP